MELLTAASVPTCWPPTLYHGPQGLAAYGKYWKAMEPTLELVWRHTTQYGTILHGGGHLGLMSLALAQRFQAVYVYEAAEDNYGWLAANVAEEPRIQATYGALGDGQPVALIRHKYSATHHARGPGDVPCYRIDDVCPPSLDVLLLDLEGGELVALQHAQETLAKHRPLLIIEEWFRWARRYDRELGDVARFLDPFGYRQIDAARMDLVFACERTDGCL